MAGTPVSWQKLAFDVAGAELEPKSSFPDEEEFRKSLHAMVLRARSALDLRLIDSAAFEKNVRLRDLITKTALFLERCELQQLADLGGKEAVKAMILAEGDRFEQLLSESGLVVAFESFEDYAERVEEILLWTGEEPRRRSSDLSDQLNRITTLLGGKFVVADEKLRELLELSADRNLFVHSGGIVDAQDVRRRKRWNLPPAGEIGTEIRLQKERVDKARALVREVADQMQKAAEVVVRKIDVG